MITILIILCSILGMLGAILNCRGMLKYSYVIWVIGNVGWVIITILTDGNVFTLCMWGVYVSTSVIGLISYRKVKE